MNDSDLWTLFVPQRGPEQRRMHYLRVIGRMKPEVTVDAARADMNLIARQIAEVSPASNKDWTVAIEPLRQSMVAGELKTTSLVLAGVTALVLLMACANVANLLLARGAGRSREFAIRASLGGSRTRIVRQLVTESLLLASLGGAVGIAAAWILVRTAPSFLPAGTLPVSMSLALDARVTVFAVAITLLTGVLFGLAPAWQVSRTPLGDTLRAGGRSITGAAGAFRAMLAAGGIAVAVTLVAGAGLLLRTLGSLNEVDPGFRADKVLTMRVSLPSTSYTPERARLFYEAAQREIGAVPGVLSASFGGSLPLQGGDISQAFEVTGQPGANRADRAGANYQMVGPQYFETMGITFLSGRPFDAHDTVNSNPVCVVNEELVRRHLGDQNPIGARLRVDAMDMSGPKPVLREIVGVIRQVKIYGPGEKERAPEIYVPILQNGWFWASLVVRAAGDPSSLAPAVKAAIARVDKDLPVTNVRTMEQVAADAVAQPRFRAELVGSFAIVALALAATGIFGVLAYAVSQRTREFGIRMALGARPANVLRMVVSGGLRITLLGIAMGLAGAAALTRSLATLLFGVQPLDPVTFVAAPALLALVALAACAWPAWRAARVDPAVALRQD
jgi:putative ABC transport system permease protein